MATKKYLVNAKNFQIGFGKTEGWTRLGTYHQEWD